MYINDIVECLFANFPNETQNRCFRRTITRLQENGLIEKRPKYVTARQAIYIAYGLLTRVYLNKQIDLVNMVAIHQGSAMIQGDLEIAPVSISINEDMGAYSIKNTITLSAGVISILKDLYLGEKYGAVLVSE